VTRVKAVAFDVDGVLTDGAVWWGPEGQEWKRFCFRDIMGVSLARRGGLILALISGEASPLVDRFAEKMGITDVYKGCKDKAAALRQFASARGLGLDQIAFMGDDVNDVAALQICGYPVSPADGHPAALAVATLVTEAPGGHGAVREVLDRLLGEA
jgi:3-deoxy-D-manno-octulosonate 8-phosphate phosphatase (KDO 8-P phosphatase)